MRKSNFFSSRQDANLARGRIFSDGITGGEEQEEGLREKARDAVVWLKLHPARQIGRWNPVDPTLNYLRWKCIIQRTRTLAHHRHFVLVALELHHSAKRHINTFDIKYFNRRRSCLFLLLFIPSLVICRLWLSIFVRLHTARPRVILQR